MYCRTTLSGRGIFISKFHLPTHPIVLFPVFHAGVLVRSGFVSGPLVSCRVRPSPLAAPTAFSPDGTISAYVVRSYDSAQFVPFATFPERASTRLCACLTRRNVDDRNFSKIEFVKKLSFTKF